MKYQNNTKEAELRAYAIGYHDGRAEGVESNPYKADKEDMLRHMYRRGYDAGVTDFDPIVTDPFTGRAYDKREVEA